MKFTPPRIIVVTALLSLATASGALAHVTLEASEAPANSFHKAVFRIAHGCEGSPTVAIRIQIPDSVTGVKPQPKPGWAVTTDKSKLDPPLNGLHGEKITEIVREVTWSGGNLPDEHYDEFAVQMRLPSTSGAVLTFPVIQQCEAGVNRWIERPHAGHHGHEARQPAPQLKLR